MAAFREKYTFKVEWLDQVASLKRYYLLQYYVMNGTNELELVRTAAALAKLVVRPCVAPCVTASSPAHAVACGLVQSLTIAHLLVAFMIRSSISRTSVCSSAAALSHPRRLHRRAGGLREAGGWPQL